MSIENYEDDIVSEMSWVSLLYKIDCVLNNITEECAVINKYKNYLKKLDICDDIQNQILKYICSIVDYEDNCKIINEYNLVRNMFD